MVVVACGTHVDVASEAPLRGLLEDCPTHVWGGFPVLDRRTLRWPGSPVFLLGRSASLVEGCLSENPIVVLRAGGRSAACNAKTADCRWSASDKAVPMHCRRSAPSQLWPRLQLTPLPTHSTNGRGGHHRQPGGACGASGRLPAGRAGRICERGLRRSGGGARARRDPPAD